MKNTERNPFNIDDGIEDFCEGDVVSKDVNKETDEHTIGVNNSDIHWECKETGKTIPSKINICGMEYRIEVTDDYNKLNIHGKLANGIVNHYERTICLSARQTYESIIHTLLHEVVHVIEWLFDRHNEHTDLTEWQIDMLATGILSMLLNNNLSMIKR